jgi:peptide/nickel transport system substrate-binding protein
MAGHGRISRRQALRGAALAGSGLAAAALLGCRQESPPAAQTTSTAPQAKRGGTLNRLTPQNGTFLSGVDPHIVPTSEAGFMGLFYQTLMRLNPRTFEIEPELAQKWETPSETQYIFHLQPGVKWHNKAPVNGRALTADDIVYSLKRMQSDDPRFISKSLLASVERIEAVDKATVRITAKEPNVTTLGNLAGGPPRVLASEVVDRFEGKFTTAESVVGTGAFVAQSKDDVAMILTRNPDYWKPGLPYLDEIRLRYVREPQAQWSAFLAGQIDMVYIPGTEAKKIFADQTKTYNAEWFTDVSSDSTFANVRVKPFDDARVTKALRLLIDHE